MPKKSKPQPKLSVKPKETKQSKDYEQYLIDKIAKCQRISADLEANPIWAEIREDYEQTAKGLDMAWAFEDLSGPRIKHMQITKMAAQTFMNLLDNYKHDLELAKKELEVFRNPKVAIQKDYDNEGVAPQTRTVNTNQQGNAYHNG